MIKTVIFDLDGTLTEFNLDLKGIKRKIYGADTDKTLLEIIGELKGQERKKAEKILFESECEAAKKAVLNRGVKELLGQLSKSGIKIALVTRNNRKAADIISSRFGLKFDAVVSREDTKPKPSGEALAHALKLLGVTKDEAIFVGDHKFDIEAGKAAGIKTGILKTEHSREFLGRADFALDSIGDLEDYLFPNSKNSKG